MPMQKRFPTRDEWICMAPGIGVSLSFLAIAGCGAIMGWLPRTAWTVLLMVLAGVFLAFGLSLTPPVLQARERMLKARIIEPAEVDLEPDDPSAQGHGKTENDTQHDKGVRKS